MPFLPLVTLTLATFVIGSAELMIQGLLPEVARGLGVAIPAAGLLITAYAFGVTFGSPLVTLLTLRMQRKAALLALMAVFAAATWLAQWPRVMGRCSPPVSRPPSATGPSSLSPPRWSPSGLRRRTAARQPCRWCGQASPRRTYSACRRGPRLAKR